eukprot:5505950-Ditylum_brightwellii.AAC.1
MRMLTACGLARFYNDIGRALTPTNMRWDVVKDFKQQMDALEKRCKEDGPETPKISKALPILKWTESFSDFLSRKVGVQTITLSYGVRENSSRPATIGAQENSKPHSSKYGSIKADLVARASHLHSNYKEDNSQVYYYLEEATRGTQYAALIKPKQRSKDGRGA